jgi:hypothetical protein
MQKPGRRALAFLALLSSCTGAQAQAWVWVCMNNNCTQDCAAGHGMHLCCRLRVLCCDCTKHHAACRLTVAAPCYSAALPRANTGSLESHCRCLACMFGFGHTSHACVLSTRTHSQGIPERRAWRAAPAPTRSRQGIRRAQRARRSRARTQHPWRGPTAAARRAPRAPTVEPLRHACLPLVERMSSASGRLPAAMHG